MDTLIHDCSTICSKAIKMTGRTCHLPKLYVWDFHKDFEDIELKKLFKIYGNVTEVYMNASGKRSTTWGFITFSSFEDAEKAIENPPNGLKVKYSSATLEFMETLKNSGNSREGGHKLSQIKPWLTNGMRKLSLDQAMSSGDDESCKVCRKDIADLCSCCQAYYCSLRCANVIRRHKFVCFPEEVASTLNSIHTKQKKNLSSQQDNSRSIDLRLMRNRNEKTNCPMTVFKGQDSSSDEDQCSVISKPKRQSDVSFSLKQEKPNQKRSLDPHFRRNQSDVHYKERWTFKGHSESVCRKQKDLRNENRPSFKGCESYSKCDTDSKSSKRTKQQNYEKSPKIQKEPEHALEEE